jgi:ribonuclease D
MFKTVCKYYDLKTNSWKEIEVSIDKKLNFDYSHCSWFAIDGEFMGLYPLRDKSVLWTIASEDVNGNQRVEMLYTLQGDADVTTLTELITSDKEKLFWVGKADMAFLYQLTGKKVSAPVYDIKLASKLVRTYTQEHSLDQLVSMFSGTKEEIVMKEQLGQLKEWIYDPSTWSPLLHQYNVNDVVYLRFLADKIKEMAKLSGREEVVDAANKVLPELAVLYANGYYRDVFDVMHKDVDMLNTPIIRGGK